MYHYVRDNDVEYPNFKNLTVDQFKKQIDFFESLYGFVTKDDFVRSIEEKKPVEKGVVLTFDDGFKDHYDNVMPVLEERNLWGIFYVPTGHYQNKKILNVHRIHHLLGKHDAKLLLNEGLKIVDISMLNENRIDEFDKEIYKDQKLSSYEFRLKRLFNYYLRDEYKIKILDEIVTQYLNEAKLYDKLYLTKEELIEMEKCGSVIGSHTVTHPVLSTLNYAQQKREIEDSYVFLDSFLDMRLKSFCYPYGSPATYNQDTFKILKECGVHHAFAVDNEPLSVIKNRYILTRMDCNRFIE
jgi:peptidoglycan/xylan/chitin deacetylase (PgdA/CDA1 family)